MTPIATLPDSLRLLVEREEHAALKAVAGIELDLPGNVAQGEAWLAKQEQPTEGNASEMLYTQAAWLFDYGLSPRTVLDLLETHSPGYERDDIANRVANALKHRQNEVGARGGEGVIMAGVEAWLANTAQRINPDYTPESIGDELELLNGATSKVERLDWLWPGHYVRGKFHLLAAKPDTGKNMLTLSIAAILSRGGKWPDGTQAPVGDTLIWSGEDSWNDTTLPRFVAAGGVRERLHGMGAITDMMTGTKRPFHPSRDLPALMRAATKLTDLRYVIIDPVSVVVTGGRGASNNNTETRTALQPLLDLARDRKIVVEGITHFAKDSSKRAVLERILESTAFGAVPRIVHVAHKFADPDKPRIWARAKGNLVEAGATLGYQFTLGGKVITVPELEEPVSMGFAQWGEVIKGELETLFAEDEPDGIETPRGIAKAWLRQLLTTAPNGQLPTQEIDAAARAHGIAPATLQRAKKDLPVRVGQNLGAQHGGWFWKWTAEDEIAPAVAVLW